MSAACSIDAISGQVRDICAMKPQGKALPLQRASRANPIPSFRVTWPATLWSRECIEARLENCKPTTDVMPELWKLRLGSAALAIAVVSSVSAAFLLPLAIPAFLIITCGMMLSAMGSACLVNYSRGIEKLLETLDQKDEEYIRAFLEKMSQGKTKESLLKHEETFNVLIRFESLPKVRAIRILESQRHPGKLFWLKVEVTKGLVSKEREASALKSIGKYLAEAIRKDYSPYSRNMYLFNMLLSNKIGKLIVAAEIKEQDACHIFSGAGLPRDHKNTLREKHGNT